MIPLDELQDLVTIANYVAHDPVLGGRAIECLEPEQRAFVARHALRVRARPRSIQKTLI